jgi:lycopene beta-cyclase
LAIRFIIDVLDKNNELGAELFSSLFATGNPNLIFKFLDEETSYLEDLQVILKCPKVPFLKAVFRRMFSF